VISTDNKGVRDIIHNEEDGYITKTGDAEAISTLVNNLLANPEKLATMQRQAHRRGKDFSWELSGDKFDKILTELLETEKS